jgi:hypothetical protein
MATPTNLPASFVSGAILTADQMNNLRGAFRVLQVVQGTPVTAEVVNSTNTYVATGLSATITPQSNTSKVLVMTRQDVGKDSGNAENRIQMRLMRGATEINFTGSLMCYTGSAILNIISQTFNYLDSPATTSATTYTTQFMNPNNTASVKAQYGGGSGIMILMEISA